MGIQKFSPINYAGLIPKVDLASKFAGGYRLGQGIKNIGEKEELADREQIEFNQKQQQEQAKQERTRKTQEDLAAFSNLENKTAEDFSSMILKYPNLEKQFKSSFELLDSSKQNNAIDEGTRIYAAINAGKPEIAENILQDKLTIAENSGNNKEATRIKRTLTLLQGDPEAAKTTAGLFLASSMGKDQFNKTFETLETQKRERETQPLEIEKAKKELESFGTDQGLKMAQTKKLLADTDKLGVETQRAVLELEAKGKITDTEDRFKAEDKLRKEYTTNIKSFTDVNDAFRKISAAEDSAVGDLSLIFSFMKMLDPGSVVREGEFATAQNAAGVSDKIVNIYNKILSGERLTKGQRKSFKGQSKGLMTAAKKRETEVRKGLGKVIKNYGLNEENVFTVDLEKEETALNEEQPRGTTPLPDKSYLKYAR